MKANDDITEKFYDHDRVFEVLENPIASFHNSKIRENYTERLARIDMIRVESDILLKVLRKRLNAESMEIRVSTTGWKDDSIQAFEEMLGNYDNRHKQWYPMDVLIKWITMMQNVYGGIVAPVFELLSYKIQTKTETASKIMYLTPGNNFARMLAEGMLPNFTSKLYFSYKIDVKSHTMPTMLASLESVAKESLKQLHIQGISKFPDFLTSPMAMTFSDFPKEDWNEPAEYANLKRCYNVNFRGISQDHVKTISGAMNDGATYHDVVVAMGMTQLSRAVHGQPRGFKGVSVVNGAENKGITIQPDNLNFPLVPDFDKNERYHECLYEQVSNLYRNIIGASNYITKSNAPDKLHPDYIPQVLKSLDAAKFNKSDSISFIYAQCKMELSRLCHTILKKEDYSHLGFLVSLATAIQEPNEDQIYHDAIDVCSEYLEKAAEEDDHGTRSQMTLKLIHIVRMYLLQHKIFDLKVEGNHRMASLSLFLSGLKTNFPLNPKNRGDLYTPVPFSDFFRPYTSFFFLIPGTDCHQPDFSKKLSQYSQEIQVEKGNAASTKIKDFLSGLIVTLREQPDGYLDCCLPVSHPDCFSPDTVVTMDTLALMLTTTGEKDVTNTQRMPVFVDIIRKIQSEIPEKDKSHKRVASSFCQAVEPPGKGGDFVKYRVPMCTAFAQLVFTKIAIETALSSKSIIMAQYIAAIASIAETPEINSQVFQELTENFVQELLGLLFKRGLVSPAYVAKNDMSNSINKQRLDFMTPIWMITQCVYNQKSLDSLRNFVQNVEDALHGRMVTAQSLPICDTWWLNSSRLTPFSSAPNIQTINFDFFWMNEALARPCVPLVASLYKQVFLSTNKVYRSTTLPSFEAIIRPMLYSELLSVFLDIGYINLSEACINHGKINFVKIWDTPQIFVSDEYNAIHRTT